MSVNCVCDRVHRFRALSSVTRRAGDSRPVGPTGALSLMLCALGLHVSAAAQPAADLPEFVEISPILHTAAQPSADLLSDLPARGYTLVVNLAPPEAPGAVADEAQRLTAEGVSYLNIPVAWQQPTAADFDLFSAVLSAARDRKVLVHCALNRRASVFTFLYRVVHENVSPAIAYADVTPVWEPNAQWREFAREILARHGRTFEFGDAP